MEIIFSDEFKHDYKKIKDKSIRLKLLKQLKKLKDWPESGKPLKYKLKNHKCLRVPPFRIIYRIEKGRIIINCFEHRKNVYK
ncbi:MAG: type II toxin-antitoxin system RelE/ParE family toxin [Nanoarchaeota archaeon]|nr:type II toxin-antitoxin system RelE/ParE family toxin [Nanoarchaeota archaeon]